MTRSDGVESDGALRPRAPAQDQARRRPTSARAGSLGPLGQQVWVTPLPVASAVQLGERAMAVLLLPRPALAKLPATDAIAVLPVPMPAKAVLLAPLATAGCADHPRRSLQWRCCSRRERSPRCRTRPPTSTLPSPPVPAPCRRWTRTGPARRTPGRRSGQGRELCRRPRRRHGCSRSGELGSCSGAPSLRVIPGDSPSSGAGRRTPALRTGRLLVPPADPTRGDVRHERRDGLTARDLASVVEEVLDGGEELVLLLDHRVVTGVLDRLGARSRGSAR